MLFLHITSIVFALVLLALEVLWSQSLTASTTLFLSIELFEFTGEIARLFGQSPRFCCCFLGFASCFLDNFYAFLESIELILGSFPLHEQSALLGPGLFQTCRGLG